MARLAEIKNVLAGADNKPVWTVYVNPLNVTSLEPISAGTKIGLVGGGVYQTTTPMAEVVGVINDCMAS